MRRFVMAGGLALAMLGCVPKGGRLEANRYQSDEYPYAVFYTGDGSPTAPLGGDWRVDNFTTAGGRRLLKNGPAYMVKRTYDVNGDGRMDISYKEPFYDLLLEHVHKEAQMWVRTVPIEGKDQKKDLAVFAERYVESVSGTGNVVVRFGAEGPVGTVGKRFASRTTGTLACELSKREAYRVDFEVANVDQLQLAESARWERASVVIVRSGYRHEVKYQGAPTTYPVLMLIGMSARPQDFDALEPDFERLLKQTVLGDVGQGLAMNGSETCAVAKTSLASGSESPAPAPVEAPAEAPAEVSPAVAPDATAAGAPVPSPAP